MDEQAGPGVFFSGGSGVKAAPLGDVTETAGAQYSIAGILHYLQYEWARYEVERAQWEVERAELQVRGCCRQHPEPLTRLRGMTQISGRCKVTVITWCDCRRCVSAVSQKTAECSFFFFFFSMSALKKQE